MSPPGHRFPICYWRRAESSKRNEEAEPKQKQCPVVDVSGNKSTVQCCKEQYCIGTWNVRSMNQDKLKWPNRRWQENINILGISELKWTLMGKFNSDNHYISLIMTLLILKPLVLSHWVLSTPLEAPALLALALEC